MMRSDILVSLAVVDEEGPRLTVPRLVEVVRALGSAFRFYEVIYVVRESAKAELTAMAGTIAAMPNLRILYASEGARFYRKRLISALEAIGDVVVIYDLNDIAIDKLFPFIGQAKDENKVLIGWRQSRPPSGWAYRLLSLASNNLITERAARTIILPREALGTIIARKSASIDLRFEAVNAPVQYGHFDIATRPGKGGGFGQRYELLMEILLGGASRFLKLYAVLGFLVAVGSALYGVYAIAIILFGHHVQEGWFSTAITQAGSTAFVAAGMSILAIAMVAMLEVLNGGNSTLIVDEVSNTNFFDKVTDLNVELTIGDGNKDG